MEGRKYLPGLEDDPYITRPKAAGSGWIGGGIKLPGVAGGVLKRELLILAGSD
jgi:hypothetical protein